MSQVKILSGITGTGKSTLANKLVNEFHYNDEYNPTPGTAVSCSTDSFFEKEGCYCFNHHLMGDANNACFKKYMNSIYLKHDLIIVDNINASEIEIAPYMLAASAFGYEAEIITIVCNSSDELKKITARNIHGMKEEAVIEQWVRMGHRKLAPWWKHTELPIRGI